ncbi:MAG: signal peptidase II [Anaerolineae bacterium]|nr:signal peptidase II [Anaerolineae bacterium]
MSKIQQADDLKAGRRSAFPTILGLAAVVFALDQATKFLVLQNLAEGESWSFFPAMAKLFQFTHITNTGAAFGSFAELGNIFKFVAILVIIAIIAFYHHLPTEYIGVRLSLGLILGGAMGNLLDRFVRVEETGSSLMHRLLFADGTVIDFIDIGFWPIFNVADMSIVMGVCVLAYYLWHEEQYQAERLNPEGGQA